MAHRPILVDGECTGIQASGIEMRNGRLRPSPLGNKELKPDELLGERDVLARRGWKSLAFLAFCFGQPAKQVFAELKRRLPGHFSTASITDLAPTLAHEVIHNEATFTDSDLKRILAPWGAWPNSGGPNGIKTALGKYCF